MYGQGIEMRGMRGGGQMPLMQAQAMPIMAASSPASQNANSQSARPRMKHSRCIQMAVDDMSKAISIFGSNTSDGETPIVLVPERRNKCSMFLQVPSGVYCLLQKSGIDAGLAAPGLQFMPYTHRVAYIVTKQSCTYDAPVLKCPTSDNVMVSVDVTLVFMIRDPVAFVYKLGAVRLDELLSGAVEEGIRGLVRETCVTEVYGLRGNRAGSLLEQLNKKFTLTGVNFTDCKITAVWLPDELADSLERTTKIKSKLETEMKDCEYQSLQARQKSDMQVQEIKRKNEQLLVAESGKKRMANVGREQEILKAEELAKVAISKAEEEASVMKLGAEADLKRARIAADKNRMEQLNIAKMEAQHIQLQADVDYKKGIADSWAALQSAGYEAEAMILKAKIETDLKEQIIATRKHELAMERRELLAEFAASGDFNIVGEAGDVAVKSLMQGEINDEACRQQ